MQMVPKEQEKWVRGISKTWNYLRDPTKIAILENCKWTVFRFQGMKVTERNFLHSADQSLAIPESEVFNGGLGKGKKQVLNILKLDYAVSQFTKRKEKTNKKKIQEIYLSVQLILLKITFT